MINLEIPSKLKPLVEQAHVVASAVFRPISRKYDTAEHTYPKELDMLAAVMDGFSEAGAGGGVSNVKQVGEGILDLEPLVEPLPAVHAIGHVGAQQ